MKRLLLFSIFLVLLSSTVFSQTVGAGTDSTRIQSSSAASASMGMTSTTGTNPTYFSLTNTAGHFILGVNGSTNVFGTGFLPYAAALYPEGAYALQFGTNNTAQATLLSNGYFGFGTPTPSANVEVWGNGPVVKITQNTGTAGNVTFTLGAAGTNNTNTINLGGAVVQNNTAGSSALLLNPSAGNVGVAVVPVNKFDVNGAMALGTYAGVNTAPANSLIISGNLGVGNTNPPEKISIKADSGALLVSTASDPTNYYTRLVTNYDDANSTILTGAFGHEIIGVHSSNTALMFGNVGVSTKSPASLFSVGSTSQFQVNSSGAISAATGISSSGTINFSELTASKVVFTDTSKNLTSTGIGTSSQFLKGNGSLDSSTYLTGVTVDSPLTGAGTSGSHLAMPVATSSANGYLSSTDWTTFNNKGSFSLPSLTSGSVLFSNGSTISQDNSHLYWDATYHRLGIWTTSPSQPLDVNGYVALTSTNPYLFLGATGTNLFAVIERGQANSGTSNDLYIGETADTGKIIFRGSGTTTIEGNVGIGTTAPKSQVTAGTGDVEVATNTKGLILHDTTNTAACYRIQVTSGAVVATSITCPN